MKKISMMLIALLAAVTMSANRFVKVTADTTDWSGQYLLAYMSSDTEAYVFSCVDGSNDYISVQVSSNGIIESDKLDDYAIEFESMEGGYSLKYISGGTYMASKKDTNSLVFSATKQVNEIAFYKADSVDITCKGMYFVFNSTKNQTRFRYFKENTVKGQSYKHITLFKSENKIGPTVWTPDTISVAKARQIIDEQSTLMNRSHYIKGVVTSVEMNKVATDGYANIWVVDIDDPTLKLQGYKIYKDSSKTRWTSASEIPCAESDTVMLFGEKLMKYNTTYEATPGYFVELLGKGTPWVPDTITVARAVAIIRDSLTTSKGELLMNKAHYIKGVVKNDNFGSTWPGYAMIWMTDMEDSSIELEGYMIFKNANRDKWASAEEIPCGVSDTIMLFADGLSRFNSIYETNSGYFVKIIAKALYINANSVFKYAFGALQQGMAYDSVRYKYEMIFSKVSAVDDENALHMIINSTNEKGIVGKYKVKNYKTDSSYVDGEGPVDGSLELTYKATEGLYNTYGVKADFKAGGKLYRMDTTFNISGVDSTEYEPFLLSDDVVKIPNEGDTITCAEALKYANFLGGEASEVNVYIHGFVVSNPTKSSKTENAYSFYIHDDNTAKSGIAQSYFCTIQNGTSVSKGNEVLLYGKIKLFNSVAEVPEGLCYNLSISTDIHEVAAAMQGNTAKKVLVGGQFYIVKDGVIYNAQGAVIR